MAADLSHLLSVDEIKHKCYSSVKYNQTLAALLWQPKVAEVSLFQVAEAPTNMYNYTLPDKYRNARFLTH